MASDLTSRLARTSDDAGQWGAAANNDNVEGEGEGGGGGAVGTSSGGEADWRRFEASEAFGGASP